jgi:uncharacterized phage protein (TIGR02218 family)
MFTNWPLDVQTTDLLVWSAADIDHGSIQASLEMLPDQLEISLATRDENHPMRLALNRNDIAVTDVAIYESDAVTLAYDSTAPVYSGRCESVSFEPNGLVRLSVGSIFRLVEQEAPRPQFQRPCNHRLYDSFCGLSEAAYTTSGSLTGVSSDPPYIEAAEFGAKATLEGDANWFALGKVTIAAQTRFCVGQSGNRLYLNAAFKLVTGGMLASARAGCDKRIGTCVDKFANSVNYLGFPYMPNRNPQFEALQTPKPSGGKKS